MINKNIGVEGSDSNVGQGYSKFIILGNKKPLLTAKINPFGIKNRKDRKKKNIFGKIEEKNNHLSFYSKTSNPKLNGFITGVSTIIIGKDIWGEEEGFEFGQVKNFKNLETFASWKFKIKEGFADFVWDIWLNKSRKGKCCSNDVEIMVWLDSNFEVPWKEIGKVGDFRVRYEKKTRKRHPWDPGHAFAFIPIKKSNRLEFDYLKLINFCEKFLKRNLKDYWIRSVYLGTEIANNTEVSVELKKAHLNFN